MSAELEADDDEDDPDAEPVGAIDDVDLEIED